MPVGRVNTKKKDDATQKLKEIKQRQQNWLRQREQSKLKEDARPKISSAPSSSKPNESAKLSLSKKPAAIPVKQESEIQRRFKNWVNVRENGTNGKEDAAFDDNLSIVSGVESELARLVTPELPVAEEKFDDLAEKIAHKVRNDLGFSHSRASTHHTQSTDITEMGNDEYPSWNSERCKTFTHDAPGFNHLNTSGLACHSCAICKKIMVSSRNIPMMIIPCGHTLCKACSEGRHNCPSCDCSIMSLTVNIMLQQVIQEYHTLPAPSGGGHNHKHKDVAMEDSTPKQRYVEDNRRNKMASYTSQLANLRTRHDILIAEQKGLVESQKQLSNKIRQDEAQLASVEKQEQEIEKAILDLHERLAALQEHKEHYDTQVSEMKEEKCKVDGKVTLLTTTISSLVREIEKVSLLAESEN